jgi:hypothetical protein
MNDLRCPQCGLPHTKKNGHTHYRKQNYQCLSCGRQFVLDSQWIDQPTRALIKKLLLERIPLGRHLPRPLHQPGVAPELHRRGLRRVT